MKAIKFNYPPAVAQRYIEAWRKQVEAAPGSDDRIKYLTQDVCTLCELAVRHLKSEPTKE